VDIDFPVVYRAMAGIDSLAQAAGRCNREGKLPRGMTYVFETEDKMPLFIRQAAQAAQEIIRKHPGEILSLEAVEDYFQHYYWLQEDRLDADGILQKTVADLANGNFPFHEIALEFKIIKNIQTPVIIPWDYSSRKLINSLRYAEHTGALARKLQRYTVQVFKGTIDALIKAHALEIIQGQYSVLKEDYRRLYRDNIGLCVKNLMDYDPEELIA
jgi:CRISPR-associated endonuclease/helicase Cas3